VEEEKRDPETEQRFACLFYTHLAVSVAPLTFRLDSKK
jgi:hypothetical protein